MKILENLNKTLPHEECEQECVAKEIEGTGLVAELANLDPSTLTAALSNPGQHQQTFDPVLDKVVGSALAVTDACRPTTTTCFKCIKVFHLFHILFFIFVHSSNSLKMNTIIFFPYTQINLESKFANKIMFPGLHQRWRRRKSGHCQSHNFHPSYSRFPHVLIVCQEPSRLLPTTCIHKQLGRGT